MRNASLLLSVLLLAGWPAAASVIVITPVSATLSGMAGDTLTFQGSLTNSSLETVYLNGAQANIAVTGIDADVSLFLVNAPLSLDGSESTGPFDLFTVTISPSYSGGAGLYTIGFDIIGGADSEAQEIVGSADFQVEVVTPEPGQVITVSTGLAFLAASLRRFRAR